MNPDESDETVSFSSQSQEDEHREGPSGWEDGGVSPRPRDWIVHRPGFDVSGAASYTTKKFRNILRRFSEKGTLDADSETWAKVAGAEVAAVGSGRKPVFHEHLIAPADALASAIRPRFPELHIEGTEGHIIVADPRQLEKLGATFGDVREAVESDEIGIFLGYGMSHWRKGTAQVLIFAGDGTLLTGFYTRLEAVKEFGEERAKDYEAAFAGVYFRVELRPLKRR